MSLADGLVSSWRYNNNGIDSAGGHTLINNGPVYDNSIVKLGSYSAFFDGLNDNFIVTNHSDFNFTTGVTISMWVYIIDIGGGIYLICKRDGLGNSWYVFAGTGGVINMGLYTDLGLKSTQTSGGVITTGSWQNVVCVFDGDYIKIYHQGVLRKKTNITGPATIDITEANIYIGSLAGATFFYDGYIDQTDIWGRVLSDGGITEGNPAIGEIAEIWNNGDGVEIQTSVTGNRRHKLMGLLNA